MATVDDVKAMDQHGSLATRAEAVYLANQLAEDEILLSLTHGTTNSVEFFHGRPVARSARAACTNRRVILITVTFWYNIDGMVEVPLTTITSIKKQGCARKRNGSYQKASFTIYDTDNTAFRMYKIPGASLEPFITALVAARDAAQARPVDVSIVSVNMDPVHPFRSARSTRASSDGNLADQLNKLVSLHDSGALTDDEFADAKAKLISGWDTSRPALKNC